MHVPAPAFALLLLVMSCQPLSCSSQPAASTAATPQARVPAARPPVRRPPPPRLPPAQAGASNSSEHWTAIAETYAAELAACRADCAAAAYAVVVARKNAVGAARPPEPPLGIDPVTPPDTVVAFVASVDAYLPYADPSDPELPALEFIAASAQYRYRQDDAVERLEAILRRHRYAPAAEYAANQLLDLLTRLERTDEVRVWVIELLADHAFLEGKPDLRATLERIARVLGQAG